MQRISTTTRAPDLFGAGKDGFRDGNKAAGIAATELNAAWFNDVQENLARLIESAGIALVAGDTAQLSGALVTKGLQGRYFTSANAGGTADALTGAYQNAPGAFIHGMTFCLRAGAANATAAPTFTPNDGVLAAKTIVKGANAALVPGDIAGAGHWLELQYDLTLGKWVLQNPATASVPDATVAVKGLVALATVAEGQGGTDAVKAVTPEVMSKSALGAGWQTWQNVLGSRVAGTTYYNTTGAPILVAAAAGGTQDSSISLLVGAVTVGYFRGANSASDADTHYGTVVAIVPPGASYRVTLAGAAALNYWAELRS